MEKFLEIPTEDSHTIYGTLNGCDNKKDKLIIFVHGLSGNQHEHQYFNAVPFFCSRNFDTFRFDLYSRAKGARCSSESSVSTHAMDIDTVVAHFKDEYKGLYLVGHSLGCLAIMNANLEAIAKVIYWDPTNGFKSLKEKSICRDKNANNYILHWGWEAIVSEKLITEWKESSDVKKYAKRISGNCSFVFSENSKKYDAWREYIGEYDYAIIKGASHRFVEDGVLEELYEETYKLLKNQ